MTEPWRTYHNPMALKRAARVALIGGPLVGGWLLIVLLAPTKVPLMQAFAALTALATFISVIRLGSERVSTDFHGLHIYPAFRRSIFVAWQDIAFLDTKTRLANRPPHSDIEDLAASLFDLDSGPQQHEVVELTIVTRTGRKVPLPIRDEEAHRLVQQGWHEYVAQFDRSLFND